MLTNNLVNVGIISLVSLIRLFIIEVWKQLFGLKLRLLFHGRGSFNNLRFVIKIFWLGIRLYWNIWIIYGLIVHINLILIAHLVSLIPLVIIRIAIYWFIIVAIAVHLVGIKSGLKIVSFDWILIKSRR